MKAVVIIKQLGMAVDITGIKLDYSMVSKD